MKRSKPSVKPSKTSISPEFSMAAMRIVALLDPIRTEIEFAEGSFDGSDPRAEQLTIALNAIKQCMEALADASGCADQLRERAKFSMCQAADLEERDAAETSSPVGAA